MSATRGSINAFESQLAIALKAASITAAANVIQSNPEMTLEEFYTIIRPQGVTESITLGELVSVLSGEPLDLESDVASTPSATAAPARRSSSPAARSAKPKAPRKKRPPKVNCRTEAGKEAYHRSILEYLATVDDWVRTSDVMAHCGGNKSQHGSAMRDNLIAKGLVKSKGKSFGMRFSITPKGKRKLDSYSDASPPKKARSSKAAKRKAGSEDSSRTKEARSAYRATLLKFLHGNKWRSGPEISDACGGNAARRNRAVRNLIAEGLVESNGKHTGNVRYRRKR